jgi:SAM-dependent methyltransferase
MDADRVQAQVYVDEVAARALASLTGAGPDFGAFLDHLDRASGLARIDVVPRGSRLGLVKRLMLRVGRVFTGRQAAFNGAAVAALKELGETSATLAATLKAERSVLAGLRQELGRISSRLDDTAAIDERLDTLRRQWQQRVAGFEVSLAASDVAADEVRDEMLRHAEEMTRLRLQLSDATLERLGDRTTLRQLQGQLDMLLREMRGRLPEPPDSSSVRATAEAISDQRASELYAEFEDVFRGTRDEIIQRQKVYLDLLAGACQAEGPVIDIGCGRGEWLELLTQHDIEAIGVDTNESVLERARQRGLEVRSGDGLAFLADLPPSSVRAVSAFHFAEHIGLTDLMGLIDASLRALQPGGLLILETPNPTNLVVGAAAFYLDPTHRRPLHPQFLEFLVRARGFVDVDVHYLNPASDSQIVVPPMDNDIQAEAMRRVVGQLNWALFGPQDYAVVGRKA